MSVPTERSDVRAPARISEGDASALRAVLVDHRRARADQIEALLLLAADGAEVERRELVLARLFLPTSRPPWPDWTTARTGGAFGAPSPSAPRGCRRRREPAS